VTELRQYKEELNDLLEKVNDAMRFQDNPKPNLKTKPSKPISSSLPNRLSALFLNRINAALNFSPNLDENEGKVGEAPIPTGHEAKRTDEGYVRAESLMMMASVSSNLPFNPMVFVLQNLVYPVLNLEESQRGRVQTSVTSRVGE